MCLFYCSFFSPLVLNLLFKKFFVVAFICLTAISETNLLSPVTDNIKYKFKKKIKNITEYTNENIYKYK